MGNWFSVAGGGLAWSVALKLTAQPPKACWFCRGPSGRLLGPFARSQHAERAASNDIATFKGQQVASLREGYVPEEPCSALPGATDPFGQACLDNRDHPDEEWNLWRIEQQDGSHCFVVEGPESLVPDLFLDEVFENWERASNAALKTRIGSRMRPGLG
ncbi:hypothetical protein [Roseomonas sp. 18066]|uniref:hypothetical protein n=1 Tax=Roseomonas sp. 18066 TaxID=2681412 RepID=UPI00135BA8A1|nr:hypothetical protein [Roseomonas sp. 18066]